MAADEEPQTAMLLTQQEWDDLEAMVTHYRDSTDWIRFAKETMPGFRTIIRQRVLADRIIDANT